MQHDNSTMNDPADAVLTKMGWRQVSQVFRVALALRTFAARAQCVHQAFIGTFKVRQCSQCVLNVVFYLQQVLCERVGNVLWIGTPTTFHVLL